MRPFPFRTTFSLQRLVEFWERAAEAASPWAPLAEVVRGRLMDASELGTATLTREEFGEHAELVDLMMSAVFPRAQWRTQVAAVMPPFEPEVYYATPTSGRLAVFDPDAIHRRMSLDEYGFEFGRTMMAYYLILEQRYGVPVPYDFPLVLTLADPDTGLDRHFKFSIDTRFVWIEGEGPTLSDADLKHLLAEPTDRSRWERIIPPHHFTLHGFGIVTAVDVTDQQVLSALKDALLQRDGLTTEAGVDQMEGHLRALLRCPDLRLGLLCLDDGTLEEPKTEAATRRIRPVGRSLLLSHGEAPSCPNRGASLYAEALEARAPVVASDLAAREPQTAFETHLIAEGWASATLAPLRIGARTVGLLELVAPEPGALNAFNTMKLAEVTGLFATALQRSLDEREDHIQAVIKAQCTALHPVVEWRFREAALRFLDAPHEEHGRRHMEPIVFRSIYPLYGLSDIRGSATHRAEAIAADLTEQLSLAFAAIVEAASLRSLPGLDELGFRLQRTIAELEDGLSAEHELGVVEFVQRDVEGFFDHIAAFGPSVRERVEAYRAALDPSLGIVYEARRRYEASVAEINEAISCHLDRQEEHAQALAPHYFEKYKTDGVEHNVYVGPSLLEDPDRFDPLALRNLRLWQLMTMCGTAWALDRTDEHRPMPLEVAHLVLAQSAPLAIRFRYDEKRFDMDGAYNTRYEIVKKRIDKATLEGSEERLTRPGHLAVVYTQARAAAEYRTYFDYLQAAGYLDAGVEEFALEPMPGAHGLRALRVPIAARPPGMELDVTADRTREAAQSL